MKNIPEGVRLYMSHVDRSNHPDGYLCLNENDKVILADGWVGEIDLNSLDGQSRVVKSLPILEGLLPPNKTGPTVIHNAHIDKESYFDIHIFYAGYTVCVVFIDKTRSAKMLQQEQQIRLTEDFINDQKRRGNQ